VERLTLARRAYSAGVMRSVAISVLFVSDEGKGRGQVSDMETWQVSETCQVFSSIIFF
jgi:hypothetical protein